MRRATRWWLGAVLAVVAVGPAAWAEREKKPATAPAKPSDPGLKPPAGKPTAAARPGSGAMVKLDGGTFRMGADDLTSEEKPVHEVSVATFWMDVTEVTVAAYQSCVKGGGCTTTGLRNDGVAELCNWGKADRADHPINCVDWSQATAFCKWANKRLPTEEEWEFAARPGGSKYPWGDAAPGGQLCWDGDGSDLGKGKRMSTCAVGSFAAGHTKTGLKDMAGNVIEWAASKHCDYRVDGYDVSTCSGDRILRGGYWNGHDAAWTRGAFRHGDTPWSHEMNVGFRCARSE